MTDDERELLLATAKAVAHLIEKGAPELDGALRRRLLELIPRIEGTTPPEAKAPG